MSLPTTRPDKKLSLFTSSLFPNGEQSNSAGASGSPVVAETTSRRKRLLRDGLILLVSIILSVAFIVWGPAGDFIAGRAFTVSTTNEIAYVYYNWTMTLPLTTPSLNMQAYNNRLIGSIRFTRAPISSNHFTINIETTAPGHMFKLTPWVMAGSQQAGFGIVVSDLLPNSYGIDYANVVVGIPAGRSYGNLTWNTYPPAEGYQSIPGRRWDVHFDNLTEAGIGFDRVMVKTDGGSITSSGVRGNDITVVTVHGDINGNFTAPENHLHNSTNGAIP
jgi:hypothetical protein